jgi:Flp pilus assembly protein TadG
VKVRRGRGCNDDGLVTVELVAGVMIVVVLFLPIVLYGGRVAQGERTVQAAAQEAARAATLQSSPGAAAAEARRVAEANLRSGGVTCSAGAPDVRVTSDLRPGGRVTVTVHCEARMGDLGILNVLNPRPFEATSTQVVDTYRSTP